MCFGSRRSNMREEEDVPAARPARLTPPPRPETQASRHQPPPYKPSPSDARDADIPPPPGPPPPPTEHPWAALVPDTALLPPPPALFTGHDRSPSSNAAAADAEAAERWCAANPLAPPGGAPPPAAEPDAAVLVAPPGAGLEVRGSLVRSRRGAGDACVLAWPPAYVAGAAPAGAAVAYYEARLLRGGGGGGTLALGFAALPYPGNRLPGWHRGSLAVHGDDGRRYVNDRWGGREFADPMRAGGTYGIGMRFAPRGGGGGAGARPEVEVFFTRDGELVGRWDLHEETDAETDLPVTGLEGDYDLCCAIGTYGEVEADVLLEPDRWLYKGL